MTSRLLTTDGLLVLLVAAAWVAAAGQVGLGRVARPRIGLALLAAAAAVTLARVGVIVGLGRSSWDLVAESVVVTVPAVIAAGGVAVALLVPALVRARPAGRVGVAALRVAAGAGVAGLLGVYVVGGPLTPVAVLLLLLPIALLLVWTLSAAPAVRAAAGAAAALLVAGALASAWSSSRLPDALSHAAHAVEGPHAHAAALVPAAPPGVPVTALRGPAPGPGEPVRRTELTARTADVRLPSGRTAAAWTYDGRLPGPTLEATVGDLVEVRLRNLDLPDGVTIHWHGYPVPAGEDGVAGVTQDAVLPGGEFTYRFRATVPGTFWYHAHQVSSEAVARGLYGVLVVHPRGPRPDGLDLPLAVHTLGGTLLLGDADGPVRRVVAPGTLVRLRVVDTDSSAHVLALRGAPFRLAAVDGADVSGRTLTTERLRLAAGGRYDLRFRMPDGPVALTVDGRRDATLLLAPDGTTVEAPDASGGPLLDVTQYPTPGPVPKADEPVALDHTYVLDRRLGFLDGRPAYAYTVDGATYPNVPTLVVRQGDRVRLRFVNRGLEPHPMHVHGHTVTVVSRDGVPASGPLRMDSVEVGPGEVWVVELHADNPGIWMDHCHNLEHAVEGMVMHLAYEGVTTPFTTGAATGNRPE